MLKKTSLEYLKTPARERKNMDSTETKNPGLRMLYITCVIILVLWSGAGAEDCPIIEDFSCGENIHNSISCVSDQPPTIYDATVYILKSDVCTRKIAPKFVSESEVCVSSNVASNLTCPRGQSPCDFPILRSAALSCSSSPDGPDGTLYFYVRWACQSGPVTAEDPAGCDLPATTLPTPSTTANGDILCEDQVSCESPTTTPPTPSTSADSPISLMTIIVVTVAGAVIILLIVVIIVLARKLKKATTQSEATNSFVTSSEANSNNGQVYENEAVIQMASQAKKEEIQRYTALSLDIERKAKEKGNI